MNAIRSLVLLILMGVSAQLVAQLDSIYVDSLEKSLALQADSNQLATLLELATHLKEARRRDSADRAKGLMYARMAKGIAYQGIDQNEKEKALKLLQFYYRRNGMDDSARMVSRMLNEFEFLEGYTLPSKEQFDELTYPLQLNERLQHYHDTTGLESLEEVLANNNFVSKTSTSADYDELPGAFWFRFSVVSNKENWQEHTFFTGGDQYRWDSVWVYHMREDSSWKMQLTGEALPESQWLVKKESNHFRLNIPPNSQTSYFVRVKGTSNGMTPNRISLFFINYEAYLQEEIKDHHVNGIFQGIVLIQFLFFLLFYIATRDHIYGNYVVYILGLGLFIITVNYSGILFGIDRTVQIIMYVTAISLCVVGMLMFSFTYLNLDQYLPAWRRTLRVFIPLFIVASIILSIALVLMFRTFNEVGFRIAYTFIVGILGIMYGGMVVAAAIFLPIWGIRVYRQGYSPAKYYLLATAFLIVGVITPIIISFFAEQLVEAGYKVGELSSTILEAGIALQLSLFALAVGHKRNLLEKERRAALENNLEIQQKINAATDRFVPYEFLRSMGRESILDVNLGDQVEKRVTLFFSDIRDYTTLSEQMTPQQNFVFLNQYLGRVGPVIKTNRGFVNQYYGDGLLALFMADGNEILSEKDAVKAALDMHKQVQEYNEERVSKERQPIRIGIGIHTGPLMLGVIGDEKRMNVGVVSDTVNTTARLEGLTKRYGSTTIISGATYQGIDELDEFQYRPLGEVMVKGRKTPIALYDFFDGDPGMRFDQKSASLQYFLQGYEAYYQRHFKEAARLFQAVLEIFPDDMASQYFLTKAEYYLAHGVPDEWTGVEVLTTK
ncbi:MAG: adenylate/guanylate cyclase domain-containing protein [Bacteroidota bacterium]